MIKVIPSILVKTSEEFFDLVKKFEPHTDRIHLDIIDGKFAPNETIKGYEELAKLKTDLKFEVHLMVQNPAEHLPHWYASQADHLIIHAESEGDILSYLMEMEKNGKQSILAFNPGTDPSKFASLVPHCHHVQFMTVKPGFYGGAFESSVISTIENFHMVHRNVIIAVDGAMTPETAPKACAAGASLIVSGSYLVKSDDVAQAMQDISSACSK